MRAFALSFIFIAAAAPAFAQEPARPPAGGPPDLSVVKQSWSKERVGWERDPFGGPVGHFDQVRMRARNEKRIEDAKRGGSAADTERARRDAATDAAIVERARKQEDTGPPRYAFLYKASFANNGAKAIREMDWDYVFFEKATGEEVGRHQFTSAGKIEPHKRKEFSFFIPSPPARRVSVYDLGKRERDGFDEQVVIVRVLYEDGTEWRR